MENKNFILEAPNELEIGKKEKYYVFLGGPIQGAQDWQGEIITRFKKKWGKEVIFCNPRREIVKDEEFNYHEQVDWESKYLNISDLLLFWIPKRDTDIPGRSYAQTTRTELGEWLDKCKISGKKMILGIDPEVSGYRYIKKRAPEDFGIDVLDNFESLCQSLELSLKFLHDQPRTWYTSDTHFGSQRALEYSKRPFMSVKDMDMTLIRNWNSKIKPRDTVYHLGDFGDWNTLKYLNGNIILVMGNYEKDDQKVSGKNMVEYNDYLLDLGFKKVFFNTTTIDIQGVGNTALGHEPLDVKKEKEDFSLFGHIHARQKVKRYGCDVGCDGNYYSPYSEDDIIFYYEAIKKYYDENVFE